MNSAVDTRRCTVSFEGGSSVCWTKAGSEVKAIIQAKDRRGNKVNVGGLSSSFEASVHLAPERWTPQQWRKHVNALTAASPLHTVSSLAQVKAIDNKDGSYTISFWVNNVGEYLLVGVLPPPLSLFF